MKNKRFNRLSLVALSLAAFLVPDVSSAPVLAQSKKIGSSGLPVPRYASLKSDRVNVRKGPRRDHDIAWTFVKSRLPVEIIQEYEDWRKIRDWEGKTGWVFRTLLTGYRSVLVSPWGEQKENVIARRNPGEDEQITAYLEPYVLAGVLKCEDGYCKISGQQFEGWVEQNKLFGVYPDEEIN